MNPLSAIVGIIVLGTSILLAEDSNPRSGIAGDVKGTSSNHTPILPPPANHSRFEYKVHVLDQGRSAESALNELGREGWELVSVVIPPDASRGATGTAYLKRIFREPAAPINK